MISFDNFIRVAKSLDRLNSCSDLQFTFQNAKYSDDFDTNQTRVLQEKGLPLIPTSKVEILDHKGAKIAGTYAVTSFKKMTAILEAGLEKGVYEEWFGSSYQSSSIYSFDFQRVVFILRTIWDKFMFHAYLPGLVVNKSIQSNISNGRSDQYDLVMASTLCDLVLKVAFHQRVSHMYVKTFFGYVQSFIFIGKLINSCPEAEARAPLLKALNINKICYSICSYVAQNFSVNGVVLEVISPTTGEVNKLPLIDDEERGLANRVLYQVKSSLDEFKAIYSRSWDSPLVGSRKDVQVPLLLVAISSDVSQLNLF